MVQVNNFRNERPPHSFKVYCAFAALLLPLASRGVLGLTETDRLAEYSKRHFNWPPHWNPPTPGWKALMERREKQIMALESSQSRWDGWTVLVGSASLVPNFTETGFAVARAPKWVNDKLSASLREHIDDARFEDTPTRQIDVITGALRPKFIDQDELNREILHGMKPLFEEWAGVPLKPAIAYGLRIYQNESALLMHVDKIEDHVISAILHVGHEYDDDKEPWPIVIESFDGTTQSVNLEPGDMLFYESAKCMHGRPRPFKGKYYSSIFIHYLPVDWTLTGADSQFRVPPHWMNGIEEARKRRSQPSDPHVPKLEIVGTGFNEPDCPDGWCNLQPSKHRQHHTDSQELEQLHHQPQEPRHNSEGGNFGKLAGDFKYTKSEEGANGRIRGDGGSVERSGASLESPGRIRGDSRGSDAKKAHGRNGASSVTRSLLDASARQANYAAAKGPPHPEEHPEASRSADRPAGSRTDDGGPSPLGSIGGLDDDAGVPGGGIITSGNQILGSLTATRSAPVVAGGAMLLLLGWRSYGRRLRGFEHKSV